MLIPIKYNSLTQEEFVALCKNIIPTILPEWTDTSDNDFGIALLRQVGVLGDILSNKIDTAFNNAFISTCSDRDIALLHAIKYGYQVGEATPSSVNLTVKVIAEGVITKYSKFNSVKTANTEQVFFETLNDVIITAADVIAGQKTFPIVAGQTIQNENVGVSTGTPYMRFTALMEGYIQNTIRVFVDNGVSIEEWTKVDNWNLSNSTDKHFIVDTDKYSRVSITFGDGLSSGVIPPVDNVIYVSYRIGGGSNTNLPANMITEYDSSLNTIVSGILSHPACSGGNDRETLENIQKNIPLSLKALYRCISMEDYEIMLSGFKGSNGTVKKVFASQGVGYDVNLYAIGTGGAVISDALKTEVINYLYDKKMSRDNPIILDLQSIRLNIELDVICNSNVVKATVEERIRVILGNKKDITGYAYYDFDTMIERDGYSDISIYEGGGDPYYTCHQAKVYSILKSLMIQGIQSVEIEKLTIFPKDTLKVYETGNSLSFSEWSEIEVLESSVNDNFVISFDRGNASDFTVYRVSNGVSVGNGTKGVEFTATGMFKLTINDSGSKISQGDTFIFKTLPYCEDIGIPTNKVNTNLEKMYILSIQDSFDNEQLKINITGGI